jgi:hypothetical protein
MLNLDALWYPQSLFKDRQMQMHVQLRPSLPGGLLQRAVYYTGRRLTFGEYEVYTR